jgi:hypothetical protein
MPFLQDRLARLREKSTYHMVNGAVIKALIKSDANRMRIMVCQAASTKGLKGT